MQEEYTVVPLNNKGNDGRSDLATSMNSQFGFFEADELQHYSKHSINTEK